MAAADNLWHICPTNFTNQNFKPSDMKNKQYHKATGLILLGLLLLFGCKRDQLQPATPSLLSTYHGTDKMVLKVIEQLEQPANQAILAELEKQGSINWQYKALFSSRFIKGYTLRFALGSSSNYLDAEIDAKTGEIKLFTKEMQLSKDQQVKQHLQNTRLKQGNGTLSSECVFFVFFEVKDYGNIDSANLERVVKYMIANYYSRLGETVFFEPIYNYLIVLAPSGTTAAEVEMDLKYHSHQFGDFIDVESLSVTSSCGELNESGDDPNIPTYVWIREVNPTRPLRFGIYGSVNRESVTLMVGCYKDGNVWRAVLKELVGYYSVQAQLIGDVKEVTGIGGNTTATNYCQQITDLKSFGFNEYDMPAQWYMLGAVIAHERVHVHSLQPSLDQSAREIRATLDNITVPFTGQSYSEAKDQINSLVSLFSVDNALLDIWIRIHDEHAGIEHALGGAAQMAELNYMLPMINQICGYAKTQFPLWPACTACP